MQVLGIKTWLLSKYVDDLLVVATNLPLGARIVGDKVIVTPESRSEDERGEKSAEDVTMEIRRAEVSGIMKFLEFTAEVAKGKETPVACLDTQLW